MHQEGWWVSGMVLLCRVWCHDHCMMRFFASWTNLFQLKYVLRNFGHLMILVGYSIRFFFGKWWCHPVIRLTRIPKRETSPSCNWDVSGTQLTHRKGTSSPPKISRLGAILLLTFGPQVPMKNRLNGCFKPWTYEQPPLFGKERNSLWMETFFSNPPCLWERGRG